MTHPTEDDIAVNGTRLHVRIDGTAGRPWLVLVNALATDLMMWESQVPAFAPRYRVLRYDVRGHGRSAAPPGRYSMDLLAADLLAVLAHYDARRAHVIGLSLGGVIAAAAALGSRASFASLTICDARVEMPPEFAAAIDDRNRLVRAEGMATLVQPLLERWFRPATLAGAPAAIADVRRMIAATSVAGFTGCAEALKHARVLDRLGELRLPSLFVVGDHDAAVPVDVMRDQQRRIPGAGFVEIPAAGHLSNLERPDAFNEAVLAFLDAVEASPIAGAPRPL